MKFRTFTVVLALAIQSILLVAPTEAATRLSGTMTYTNIPENGLCNLAFTGSGFTSGIYYGVRVKTGSRTVILSYGNLPQGGRGEISDTGLVNPDFTYVNFGSPKRVTLEIFRESNNVVAASAIVANRCRP